MRSYGLDLFVRTAKLQILSHFRYFYFQTKQVIFNFVIEILHMTTLSKCVPSEVMESEFEWPGTDTGTKSNLPFCL